MEFALRRSGQGGGVKEEKRTDSEDHEAPHRKDDQKEINTVIEVPPMNTTERSMVETGHTASSTKKEEVDELQSAKAEMGEVREENQRLKMCLERIMKEYQALQMQFHVIVQQDEEAKNSADHKGNDHQRDDHNNKDLTEESELVSLSLGRVRSNPKSEEKAKVSKAMLQKEEELKEDLTLGLECKFETSKSGSTTEALGNPSPTDSSEVPKEEAGESWPPNKVLKNVRERDPGDHDEVSQQNPAKKARVCVRARCDTPTMNDGCQWRKYGQKISKGNPCPRAYYRCTVAPNCPVRKQVQRYAEDMSILITTYEGTHNHPLPLSATAMASTTSAAASMLLSGSSSTSHPSALAAATPTTAADHHLHGLNFYLSDGSKPKQFYLSNPALSPSPAHPTITLDLTTPNPSSSSSSNFNRFSINPPRFPSSTSLSFGSSSSNGNAMSWTNNGFLYSYNNTQLPYNNSNIINRNMNMNILSGINLGSTPPASHSQPHQSSSVLPDTIAAATKVITADPTFQSALAAALTSIIGTAGTATTTGSGGNSTQLGVTENLSQKITKWGDLFPAASASAASTSKVNGCVSSFLNKTTASPATTQTGTSGLMFLSSSLPFSSSKTVSALSPADNNNRDNSSS